MHNIQTLGKLWSIRSILYRVILRNLSHVWGKDGKEIVHVAGGKFLSGDGKQEINLPEFWIDRTPVTNREFARFVDATGNKTIAEKSGLGCAYTCTCVFSAANDDPPDALYHSVMADMKVTDTWIEEW